MKAKTGKAQAEKGDIRPMQGTSEMGYWEFKKQFAGPAGWTLQRTAPQTYQVLDGSRRKIGNFLQQQQRNLADLEELRRRYRQNGYDAYNSSFPGEFALGALLGQMVQGLMNSDMVWREMGRHRQRSHPAGGWGGFGAGRDEPGDEGRGGFGGDSFRTDGGF